MVVIKVAKLFFVTLPWFQLICGLNSSETRDLIRVDEGGQIVSIDDAYKIEIDADKILFVYYTTNGQVLSEAPIIKETTVNQCSPGDKVAIVIHGWMGDCSQDWVIGLIKNLGTFRGGCLICLDYSHYSKVENYYRLVRNFVPIRDLLIVKLKSMTEKGYDPARMFFYAFSFGGRLALEAGKLCGNQIFEAMDTGPGFDKRGDCDDKKAAKNVQIIHTSMKRFGTRCSMGGHQNIRMGNCGWDQEASKGQAQIRAHGLCNYFYNSAFHHPFYAVPPPSQCKFKAPAAFPKHYRMGYTETRKGKVRGEIFVETQVNPPWNVVPSS